MVATFAKQNFPFPNNFTLHIFFNLRPKHRFLCVSSENLVDQETIPQADDF